MGNEGGGRFSQIVCFPKDSSDLSLPSYHSIIACDSLTVCFWDIFVWILDQARNGPPFVPTSAQIRCRKWAVASGADEDDVHYQPRRCVWFIDLSTHILFMLRQMSTAEWVPTCSPYLLFVCTGVYPSWLSLVVFISNQKYYVYQEKSLSIGSNDFVVTIHHLYPPFIFHWSSFHLPHVVFMVYLNGPGETSQKCAVNVSRINGRAACGIFQFLSEFLCAARYNMVNATNLSSASCKSERVKLLQVRVILITPSPFHPNAFHLFPVGVRVFWQNYDAVKLVSSMFLKRNISFQPLFSNATENRSFLSQKRRNKTSMKVLENLYQ